MAAFVFWLSVLFVAYTYLGYPLGIWFFSRIRNDALLNLDAVSNWPPLTVVIAVHNEHYRIAKKVENLRGLDYPQENLNILFVSDGSSDGTNEVLTQTPGIDWHSYDIRRGKPYALNRAIELAKTDIIIFCDVRQEIERGALKYLVGRLMEPGVGAVSGELVHRDPLSNIAANIGLYWKYEKWIRKSESAFSSAIGATGAFYGIHREDYVPLSNDALLDDFEIPMQIVRRGRRNVLEGRALFFDELQKDTLGERKRKIRTLTGNYQAFLRNLWLFSPRENPVFIQFISHKVFRLLVPYLLMTAFAASLVADGLIYSYAAILQGTFYTIALCGIYFASLRQYRAIGFATVFLELNASAVIAMFKFLFGNIDARWEKT